MPLVSQIVPALFNGVSQQSPAVRHEAQCEAQTNVYPTVVRGVSKRPPTEHVVEAIGTAIAANSFVHFINRDANERYAVVIQDTGVIKVFDLTDGSEKAVTNLDAAYSTSANPRADFTAITVADYTFLVNRTKTVAATGTTTGAVTGVRQSLWDIQNSSEAGVKVTPPSGKYKILGDENNGFDTFYVEASTDPGAIAWKETVNVGIDLTLDPATMPHTLVRNPNGTFTFDVVTWADRKVGDDDTNAFPSILGTEIKDIFFFRNRLGLTAKENVLLSEASNFFNFFRTTVVDLLDSDPIDVAVSHNKPSVLHHAVPFDESLFLFADLAQFALDADTTLTPRTAAIDQTTEFESNPQVRPVGSGSTMFFVTEAGRYSNVREYFVDPDSNSNDASNTTAHVPKYIPKNVSQLAASTNYDVMFALSDDEPETLYVYKYYWKGTEKVQSSWGKWTFSPNSVILGMETIGTYLYIAINRPSGTYIEKIDLEVYGEADAMGYQVYLDRRTLVTGTYNGGLDKTTFSLPLDIELTDAIEIVKGKNWTTTAGARINPTLVTRPNTYTVEVDGDYSAFPCYIGEKYEMRYEFSPQFVKNSNGTVLEGDLRLRYMTVHYTDAAFFKTAVTPLARTTQEATIFPAMISAFTGKTIGLTALLGSPNFMTSGTYKFPILSDAKTVKIELINDSYLGSHFQKAEWEGNFTKRSRSI